MYNTQHNFQFGIRRQGVTWFPQTKQKMEEKVFSHTWKEENMPNFRTKADCLQTDSGDLDVQLCKEKKHMTMKNAMMKFELNTLHTSQYILFF